MGRRKSAVTVAEKANNSNMVLKSNYLRGHNGTVFPRSIYFITNQGYPHILAFLLKSIPQLTGTRSHTTNGGRSAVRAKGFTAGRTAAAPQFVCSQNVRGMGSDVCVCVIRTNMYVRVCVCYMYVHHICYVYTNIYIYIYIYMYKGGGLFH
jgi:hypothetical protein